MLMVKLYGHAATWDDEATEWVSSDLDVHTLLNGTIPPEVNDHDAPFREGGRQGIALRAARALLGDKLSIVRKTAPPPIPEVEGVDQ